MLKTIRTEVILTVLSFLLFTGLIYAGDKKEAEHPFKGDPRITVYENVKYNNKHPRQVLDAFIIKSKKITSS